MYNSAGETMKCTCCSKTLDEKDLFAKECRHCGTKLTGSEYLYFGTVTGRLRSSEPNLQNIPIRTEMGRDIRKAFIGIDTETVMGAHEKLKEKRYFRSPDGRMTLIDWEQCSGDCHGWIHSDSPFEVERCDACDRFKTDDQAIEAHRKECGCPWPENDFQDATMAWLDDAKNASVASASTVDITVVNTLIELSDREHYLSNIDDFIKMAEGYLPHAMPRVKPLVEGALKNVQKVRELRDTGKLSPFQFGSSESVPLPGYERIEARSDFERITLIRKWADWFYNHVDSYKGRIGMQLAYLWPAIASGRKIEVSEGDAIVQVLRTENVPESEPIWEYLDVTLDEGTEKDDELYEPYTRRGTCNSCKAENVPVRDDEEDPDDDICESCWIDWANDQPEDA
jgi:hypothetical protein